MISESKLSDALKLIAVSSPRGVEWVLQALKLLITSLPASREKVAAIAVDRGLVDPNAYDKPKPHELINLAEWLVIMDVVKRGKKVSEYELNFDRQALLDKVDELEDFMRDKTTLIEWRGGNKLNYYFIRSGRKLLRLKHLAADIVKGSEANYLIVPKEKLNDLILRVQRETTRYKMDINKLLRIEWIDDAEILAVEDKLSPQKRSEHIIKAEIEELKNYAVDEEDRIEIDLEDVDEFLQKDVLALKEHLFIVKQRGDEHTRICSALEEIGAYLEGVSAMREVELAAGIRIDVVWFKGGQPFYAFEVVLKGDVKRDLYKLTQINASKKVLIVDEQRLEEAKNLSPPGIDVWTTNTVKAMQATREVLPILKDLLKHA
ncbi:MAG: hypothetical protein QXJ86_07375 [Nitrososphaerales archaeon]